MEIGKLNKIESQRHSIKDTERIETQNRKQSKLDMTNENKDHDSNRYILKI